jgi:hypothetical protein
MKRALLRQNEITIQTNYKAQTWNGRSHPSIHPFIFLDHSRPQNPLASFLLSSARLSDPPETMSAAVPTACDNETLPASVANPEATAPLLAAAPIAFRPNTSDIDGQDGETERSRRRDRRRMPRRRKSRKVRE